jgi:cell pole-organizing protein PopZ
MDKTNQTSEALQAIQRIILEETKATLSSNAEGGDATAQRPQPATQASQTILEATIAAIVQPMAAQWIATNMERIVRDMVREEFRKRDDFGA